MLPEIEQGRLSKEEVEELVNEVRAAIKSHPSRAKELGQLIPRLNNAFRLSQITSVVDWQPVGKGFLAIGHKPGGKISYEGLRMAGTTGVLTLLHENEGALSIGHGLKQQNIEWFWFPFSASSPPVGGEMEKVKELFTRISHSLQEGGKIYIHCSAGIHRTGMVAYALLRFLGYDKESAFKKLEQLRKITAEGATEERLQWADQFGE